MPRNALLTESTAENMLKIISQADYDCALSLHNWAESVGCQVAPRTGANYYRIQYNTKKPKRSLFTIECNEKRWRVKANLYHLQQYGGLNGELPERIRAAVTATRTCTRCNSRCIGGSRFNLGDKDYFTCIGSGHFFEGLNREDWEALRKLLELEMAVLLAAK